MSIIASIIVSLVIAAVSIVLSELLRPKPKIEDARPSGLGDFQFPTATEGRVVPVIFGTVKMKAPNVVWYGDFQQRPIKTTVKTGLWSKKRIVTGYNYYFGWQAGLCRGPIDAMLKIWVGEKEVFSGSTTTGATIDTPNLMGGDDFGDGGLQGKFRIQVGDEIQTVDPYLESQQGVGLTPAYRGTCYGVWIGPSVEASDPDSGLFPRMGWIGNVTTIKPWWFELQRFPNGLGLGGGDHIVNGFDANPACVIYELLTDDDWGFGFSPSDVDVAGLLVHGATLAAEGQGFSFILDRQLESQDFLRELERQIDGVVYYDAVSGQFKLNLSRGGYDIDTIPQVDETNIIEVKDFTRGTWDETSNQVRVGFSDRARDYFDTFTPAPDIANLRIQNNEQVQSEIRFPGVKDKALATKLASRELRALSVPLARATVVVDRSLYALTPIEAVAFTDTALGITKLPMRAMGLDFGDIDSGKIQVSLVQDVFGDFSPFTAPNDDSLWVPPIQEADPIPLVDSLIFEAPRAFQLERDTDGFPGTIDRIWAGGREQTGQEIMFRMWQRNASGVPAGAYSEAGEVFGFLLIGTLGEDLFNSRPNPTTGTIQVDANPDSIPALVAAFQESATPSPSDIGRNLVNLIVIDDEFLAVTSVTDQTTHIDLEAGVYSGLLDTVVAPHAQGVPVYLVFVAGGLTDATIPRGNNVDFQLRPESRDEVVSEFSAPVFQLTMDDRARRPYPPNNLFLNGVRFETTVDFDDQRPSTSGLDNRGIDVWYQRRDFRTTDEVQALGTGVAGDPPTITDAEDVDATFPAANDTKYRVEVIDDPLGAATSLFTTAFNSGEGNIFLSRTKILRENAGVVPSTLGVEVEVQHEFEGETFLSSQRLVDDFAVTSLLSGDTNMGVIAANVISGIYTMPNAGPTTLTLNLGVALGTGIVEARVNGGSFSTIISAGLTTGTIPGLVLNDTVEVRHTEPGAVPTETFLEVSNPSSATDGYAILTY